MSFLIRPLPSIVLQFSVALVLSIVCLVGAGMGRFSGRYGCQ